MSILCRLFGHKPEYGYCGVSGTGYFTVRNIIADGIGRFHADLICKCERCGLVYQVGKIHLPTTADKAAADPYGEHKDKY